MPPGIKLTRDTRYARRIAWRLSSAVGCTGSTQLQKWTKREPCLMHNAGVCMQLSETGREESKKREKKKRKLAEKRKREAKTRRVGEKESGTGV